MKQRLVQHYINFFFISYLKNEWKWQQYQEELLYENVLVHALMLNNTDICNKNQEEKYIFEY